MKKAVLLNDTSFEMHHGCEVVISNIIHLLEKNGIKTIATNPVGVNWEINHSFLTNLEKSNIVIVNGEGTLHHAQQRAIELSRIVLYVKEKLNIPIVLINATYQENGDGIASMVKHFDLIFVRETLSKNDLEQYKIKSEVVPDMTFYSEYKTNNKSVRKLIGVTDSVYLELSENLFELAINKDYMFLPALKINRGMVLFLKNILKLKIFKIINLINKRFKFYKIYQYVNIRSLFYVQSYQKYIQKIARLEFIITARYHSLCFALKAMTPFIAIKSNSHKIEGILLDVGISLDRLKKIDEVDKIDYYPLSHMEKKKIKEYVESAPIKIDKMFQDIKNLIK